MLWQNQEIIEEEKRHRSDKNVHLTRVGKEFPGCYLSHSPEEQARLRMKKKSKGCRKKILRKKK